MDYIVVVSIAAVIILLVTMVLSHSRTLQKFGILEFVLLSTVVGSMILGYFHAERVMTEQYFRLFSIHFGSAYAYMDEPETDTKEVFTQITGVLADTLPITIVGEEHLRYRNLVLIKSDGLGGFEECFFDGENPLFWSEAKAAAEPIITLAAKEKNIRYKSYGTDSALFVLTELERITPAYALMAEISLQPLLAELDVLWQQYVLYGGIFFLAFSLFVAVIVFLQERDLKKVVRITARVSEGKEDWNHLKLKFRGIRIESNEMRSLHNSLWQIASDIERMNYVKFKMLQAYYRFAPKEIEKMLQKESILDVGYTDQVNMEGTLAFVSHMAEGHIKEQEYYTLLSKVRKEHSGIILSGNSDLSIIRVLFHEETKKAYAFGVELAARGEAFICLHRTSFVYGVAGDEEQAFTYIHSAEMKVLEHYMDVFRQMGVRMVVTDYVHEAVGEEKTQRYIGYIEDSGFLFHVYEILDAYSAHERQKRIDLKPKFQKALRLFYESDAYLARNVFSEILRDCPTDEVAKWYVFVCENCLNHDNAKQQSFALFT